MRRSGNGNGSHKASLRVAQQIVRDVRDNRDVPGWRLLPEKEMLQRYDVGRGTLREGLRFLEFQGVIRIKPGPGGGPLVQSPDATALANALALMLEFSGAEFQTVAETRFAIEPVAARLAASSIQTSVLDDLEKSVQRMEAHVTDQTIFLEENRNFHDLIAWGSGNVIFGHLIESLLGISDGSVYGTDYPVPRREAIVDAHRRIFEAIERQDPDDAFSAMRDHIAAFIDYVEQKFPHVLTSPVIWDQLVRLA